MDDDLTNNLVEIANDRRKCTHRRKQVLGKVLKVFEAALHKPIVPLHVSSAPASEYAQGNTTRHAHLHDGISKGKGSLPAKFKHSIL